MPFPSQIVRGRGPDFQDGGGKPVYGIGQGYIKAAQF